MPVSYPLSMNFTLSAQVPGKRSCRDLQVDEFESVGSRFSSQGGEFALRTLVFKFLGTSIDPCLAVGEHSVDETGQVASHGFDSFGCAPPGW